MGIETPEPKQKNNEQPESAFYAELFENMAQQTKPDQFTFMPLDKVSPEVNRLTNQKTYNPLMPPGVTKAPDREQMQPYDLNSDGKADGYYFSETNQIGGVTAEVRWYSRADGTFDKAVVGYTTDKDKSTKGLDIPFKGASANVGKNVREIFIEPHPDQTKNPGQYKVTMTSYLEEDTKAKDFMVRESFCTVDANTGKILNTPDSIDPADHYFHNATYHTNLEHYASQKLDTETKCMLPDGKKGFSRVDSKDNNIILETVKTAANGHSLSAEFYNYSTGKKSQVSYDRNQKPQMRLESDLNTSAPLRTLQYTQYGDQTIIRTETRHNYHQGKNVVTDFDMTGKIGLNRITTEVKGNKQLMAESYDPKTDKITREVMDVDRQKPIAKIFYGNVGGTYQSESVEVYDRTTGQKHTILTPGGQIPFARDAVTGKIIGITGTTLVDRSGKEIDKEVLARIFAENETIQNAAEELQKLKP